MRQCYKRDNIDLIFIPPGTTFIVQPLDTHINKGFKDAVGEHFEEVLSSGEYRRTKSDRVSKWTPLEVSPYRAASQEPSCWPVG